MRTLTTRRTAWFWAKVVLCLVGLDLLLFHAGVFWRVTPWFPRSMVGGNWLVVWSDAKALETGAITRKTAVVVGSSVVWAGVNPLLVGRNLAAAKIPADQKNLMMWGASVTDAAILADRGLRAGAWLLVYTAAVGAIRDFVDVDSPVVRVFYDSSMDIPALGPRGPDEIVAANVKRVWHLYRYRQFLRMALTGLALDAGLALPGPPEAWAAGPVPDTVVPPDAPFMGRVNPERFEHWRRWRVSRDFDDYTRWLTSDLLEPLESQSRFPVDGNPQLSSLDWMLARAREHGARAVVVYSPENPVFLDPKAARYFDPAQSDRLAAELAARAERDGARFVDLRRALEAEDFKDLMHANQAGSVKFSDRIAEIVAEEWRARVAAAPAAP